MEPMSSALILGLGFCLLRYIGSGPLCLPPHTLLSVLQGVFAQLHPRPRERDVPRRDRGLLQGCVRLQLRGGWGGGGGSRWCVFEGG